MIAPPLTLSVGAYPAERGWQWVADEATLTDELSTDPSRLADGQTVTRTVTLRAKGTLPEALPPRPVVSEPWLISFAAPVERRLILTADGPVSEAVWTWQLRPETGEPGVIPPAKIPFFNATTRRMDALEIPALPIGYASFYTNQVETGRFGPAARLAEAARPPRRPPRRRRASSSPARPPTPAAPPGRGLRRRWSPLRRWRLRRAARAGDLLAAPPPPRRDPPRRPRRRRPRRRRDLPPRHRASTPPPSAAPSAGARPRSAPATSRPARYGAAYCRGRRGIAAESRGGSVLAGFGKLGSLRDDRR